MYDAENPKLVLCDNLEVWSVEGGGGGLKMEETHVYLWPIHIDVWQKPSQYCKLIILQLKLINLKKTHKKTKTVASKLRSKLQSPSPCPGEVTRTVNAQLSCSALAFSGGDISDQQWCLQIK